MAMSSSLTALTTPRAELVFADVTYDPEIRHEASELVVRSLDPFMQDRGIDIFIASNSRLVIAALMGNRIVGAMGVSYAVPPTGEFLTIDKLATAADMRERGIGGQMVGLAEYKAQLIGARAVVVSSDASACKFYENNGFVAAHSDEPTKMIKTF